MVFGDCQKAIAKYRTYKKEKGKNIMFIFIIAIVLIIAIIMLFVYIAGIFRTKKKYLNKQVINDMTQKEAEKAVKNDPFLVCDYCGARIDTRIHKTCPQCGGAYGKDKEWAERYTPDVTTANKKVHQNYDKLRKKVKKENQDRKRKIIKIIALLVGVIVIFILVLIGAGIYENQKKLQDQTPSEKYELLNYDFQEQSVLQDETGYVKLGKIYQNYNQYTGLYDYEIEVHVSNHTKESFALGLGVSAVNHKAKLSTLSTIDTYVPADGKEHTKILKLSGIQDDFLKSVSVKNVIFEKQNYTTIAGEGNTQIINSTAKQTIIIPEPQGECLYQDDLCEIWLQHEEDDYGTLQIFNIGNTRFDYEGHAIINNQSEYTYLYGTLNPDEYAEKTIEDIITLRDLKNAETILLAIEINADDVKQSITTPYLSIYPYSQNTEQ